MKALLVRVGIDSGLKTGHWLAPVNSNNEFAYVPILEEEPEEVVQECRRTYENFKAICKELGKPLPMNDNTCAHLDPDFSELTYGDIDCVDATDGNNHRGKPLLKLDGGDLLVFFAGLDPGRWLDRNVPLVQAIVGLYVLKQKPVSATDKTYFDAIRDNNAHTRRKEYGAKDIIAFAKPAPLSGRLEKCIPIGEYDNKHYYLKQNLFEEWGGFLGRNGSPLKEVHLQRTPLLSFCDPEKFYKWFKSYKYKDGSYIKLQERNN